MNRPHSPCVFACVGAVSVLLVGLLVQVVVEQNRGPAFSNLPDAFAWLSSAGYHCTTDRVDGKIGYSFVVSREPMTCEQVATMFKGGPIGITWIGRVWIITTCEDFNLATTPGDSEPRVWGKVWAFGDENLLNEIERRYLE